MSEPMTDHEAALWREETGTAHDPADMGALLAAAVAARQARTGESEAAIARAAGLSPVSLNRAMRRPDAGPRLVRAVCRAMGLRVALVPA